MKTKLNQSRRGSLMLPALAGLLLLAATVTASAQRGPGIGKAAPEITGADVDGKPLKLSDYKGKVVLLDFWGDW